MNHSEDTSGLAAAVVAVVVDFVGLGLVFPYPQNPSSPLDHLSGAAKRKKRGKKEEKEFEVAF
jgi:hypothetical protein